MPNIMGEQTPDEVREKALKEIRKIARGVGKYRYVDARGRVDYIDAAADKALKFKP